MILEDRGTGDKELAAEIAVLEDQPQRGRVLQGLAWLRELQTLRAAATRLEELALSLEHNHRVEIRDIGREIRERMREADMADITDEELRRYANDSGWTVNRLAAECLRLRAAKAPDRERVRAVVDGAIRGMARYPSGHQVLLDCSISAIADRVADQLCAPAPKPHHAGRQAIPVINPADTPELREAISKLKADGHVKLYTGDPSWHSRVHAAADKIDRGASIDDHAQDQASKDLNRELIAKCDAAAFLNDNPGFRAARAAYQESELERMSDPKSADLSDVVATPPDEEHPLGQLSLAPIPIRTPVEVVLAKLEAAAKAATSGKWDSPKEGPGSRYHAVVSDWGDSTDGYGGNLIGESFGPADCAYIVATQPTEILALIATVREMIPRVKDWASKERAEAAQIGWTVDSDFETILNRALTVEVP